MSSERRVRLTSLRGFVAGPIRVDARQLRAAWAKRFEQQGPGHPYWLYTHIPFCPQICSFCQCSTGLKKSDRQIEEYLDWLDGEIDFFAPVAATGSVKFQYVGGGSPNLLSDAQLERLLGLLNRRHQFAAGSRRTFEFLPSSLRPDTLSVVRSLGFNRLTCGVQSWNGTTLKSVNRSQAGLDQLGATIEEAFRLGYDEFNLDLIYGMEGAEPFRDGLLEILRRRPTTVTIHNLIPTATNPVYRSIDEELDAHARFEQLEDHIGAEVAGHFPDMEWVLRPNSWILVDKRFRSGPNFSYWYYSDNERLHIDMLSYGRFAHSNILGQVSYENLSHAAVFDAQAAEYDAFLKNRAIDAALDVITDLVGDRRSDLTPIMARYGSEAVRRLEPALQQLEHDGYIARANGHWETMRTDGVFVDPFLSVLDAALDERPRPWVTPSGRDAQRAVVVRDGDRSLWVFVEKSSPGKPYFTEVGRFGIYYRDPSDAPARQDERWVEQAMDRVVAQLRVIVAEHPHLSAKEATARLTRVV